MKPSPHVIAHLPYFAALAETQSFTAAAAQMNITQAAMSYQIKSLEEKLNCTLVIRQSGSQLKLTNAGEVLINEFMYCAKRLGLVFDQLNHEAGGGILRISTPVDFGSLLMPKILSRLKDLAPKLIVELHTSDEVVDLSSSHWDMAIRSTKNSDAVPLYTSKVVLVASKKYKKQHGLPKDLTDIPNHTVLLRENSKHRTWASLLTPHDLPISCIQQKIILGNTIALKEAAKEGLGIALLPEFVVAEDIAERKLEILLKKETSALGSSFYLSKIDAVQMNTYEYILRKACLDL